MNTIERDVLLILEAGKKNNQREIAKKIGYSLGTINNSLNNLKKEKYINENLNLTEKALKIFENGRTKNAIILAAGFGLRMVPINVKIPKALLEVRDEILIERLIKQLKEKSIDNIHIVVGYKREKFEYLIDKYNVNLIVNREYSKKNNLHSLFLAKNYLEDTYIIPCDIYFEENPFNKYELYSWYMLSNEKEKSSDIKINKKREIVKVRTLEMGNKSIGVSYITKNIARYLKEKLELLDKDTKYDNSFWEEALFVKNRMIIYGKMMKNKKIVEINSYKDLYLLDRNSTHLKSEAIKIIEKELNINFEQITEILALKKGMTNRSFLFTVDGKKYIMRIPGEGTEQLINRKEEAEVYKLINNRNVCDNVLYMNPINGYKITEFIENGHNCDIENENELKECMNFLKRFHDSNLKVEHEFNILKKINFYESLWNGVPSEYSDYSITKEHIFSLKNFIEKHIQKKVLTHIDAVADNFFIFEEDGKKEIKLLDWEYAAMQDPHVDIAMFSIYSLYNKEQIDRLIDIYFENKCEEIIRIKIYAYVAACGLLWSNWCEYKRNLGVEFGEYSLKQYRYAKDYYKLVKKMLEERGESL